MASTVITIANVILTLTLALSILASSGEAYKIYSAWDYKPNATIYNGQNSGGACGYGNTRGTYGVNTMSVSTVLYGGGAACGSCFVVQCLHKTSCNPKHNSLVATVTNLCGASKTCAAPNEVLSLTPEAWDYIVVNRRVGVIPVRIAQVTCPRKVGGITVTVSSGSNPWFLELLIANVAEQGSLKTVEVSFNGGASWFPMTRDYGAVWKFSKVENGFRGFSLRLTSPFGKPPARVVIKNAVPNKWTNGTLYQTNVNF